MQSIEQFIEVKTDHLGHIYSEGFYVSSKFLKYGKCTSSSRFCEEQARWSESGASGLHIYDKYINYQGDFCQPLTFANSLDPDQTQQKVSRDQYPNRLTLWVRGLKSLSLYRGMQCRP